MELILWFFTQRTMPDFAVFMAAIQTALAGNNPFLMPPLSTPDSVYFNPPWLLVIMMPFYVIPSWLQDGVFFICAYAAVIVLARKFNLRGVRLLAALSSPVLYYLTISGNIDWLVLLGLFLPAPMALVVLAIKPQATWVLMLLIIVRVWNKDHDWKKVALTVTPLMILCVIWLMLYGIPHVPHSNNIGNRSLWPYGLIAGIPLVILSGVALWKKPDSQWSERFALAAGPFLTPYVSAGGYLGLVLAFPVLSWIGLAGVLIVQMLH